MSGSGGWSCLTTADHCGHILEIFTICIFHSCVVCQDFCVLISMPLSQEFLRFKFHGSLLLKVMNRRFAKPRPLFKNYGNRPAAIFIGAGMNNCDCVALKFDVDSTSSRAVLLNNRLWECSEL